MQKVMLSPSGTPPENNTDYEIIQEILNSSTNDFEILVKKYEKMIYNLALYKLGSREDAQDLTQECFLRAYKMLRSYNSANSAFSTWIYIICRNLICDYYKTNKHKTYSEISLYASECGGELTEIEIADDSSEPTEIITRAEDIQKIRKLIYSLPESQRDIIIMRDINGLSYIEIAEALKIKIGVVKTRIHRVRLTLKRYILNEKFE